MNDLNVGDIVLINKFLDKDNRLVSIHPFLILNNNKGIVEGMLFDDVCVLLGSFHNEKHKEYKLSFPGNVPLEEKDKIITKSSYKKKDGFAEGDQLFYFDKKYLQYEKIGFISDEKLIEIYDRVEEMNWKKELTLITNNLDKSKIKYDVVTLEDIDKIYETYNANIELDGDKCELVLSDRGDDIEL